MVVLHLLGVVLAHYEDFVELGLVEMEVELYGQYWLTVGEHCIFFVYLVM